MKRFGYVLLLMSLSFPALAGEADFLRMIRDVERLITDQSYDEALTSSFRLLPENDNQEARVQRLRGIIYQYNGNIDNAYLAFTRAHELGQLSPVLRQDVLRALTGLSLRLKQYEMSAHYAKTYLAENPGDRVVRQLFTRALYALGVYDEAISQASGLVEQYPDSQQFIWQIKALSEEKKGYHREMVATIAEMHRRFPAELVWVKKEVAGYVALGQYREAYQHLNRARQLGMPLSEKDLGNLADYALRAGGARQALSIWKSVIATGQTGRSRANLKRLVQYQLSARKYRQAWETLSDLNRQPEYPLLKLQSQVATELEYWSQAVELSQVALSNGGKNDPELWQLLGYSAMKDRQFDVAQTAFEQLKRLEPDGDADAWLNTLELLRAN